MRHSGILRKIMFAGLLGAGLALAPAAGAVPGGPTDHDGMPFKSDEAGPPCSVVFTARCAPDPDPWWQARISGGMMAYSD